MLPQALTPEAGPSGVAPNTVEYDHFINSQLVDRCQSRFHLKSTQSRFYLKSSCEQVSVKKGMKDREKEYDRAAMQVNHHCTLQASPAFENELGLPIKTMS